MGGRIGGRAIAHIAATSEGRRRRGLRGPVEAVVATTSPSPRRAFFTRDHNGPGPKSSHSLFSRTRGSLCRVGIFLVGRQRLLGPLLLLFLLLFPVSFRLLLRRIGRDKLSRREVPLLFQALLVIIGEHAGGTTGTSPGAESGSPINNNNGLALVLRAVDRVLSVRSLTSVVAVVAPALHAIVSNGTGGFHSAKGLAIIIRSLLRFATL